jgi:hypothetical protein
VAKKEVKPKYRGFQAERYSREPLEKHFALNFQELDETSGDRLFMRDLRGRDPASPADLEIATTVIQWLGSECGQYFLAQVLASADRASMRPALRDMLKCDVDVVEDANHVIKEKGKRFDMLIADLKQIADIAKVAIRREDVF